MKLLEVHVNRMLPSAGVVLEDPLLYGVSFNAKARSLIATADEPAVHLPLTIASLEPEGASDSLLIVRIGELVEVNLLLCRNSRGIDAVVGHFRTIDDDLQYLVSLTSAEDIAVRSSTIVLLQTILEIERLAGVVREIDDHVHAFGY